MNRTYPPAGYKLPKKTVLVISCIDLRLTDDLVRFLDHENLTNRYDHFILAGASLGVTLARKLEWQNHVHEPAKGHFDTCKFDFEAWRSALHQHITIAVALHDIKDVYIVEHEGCGAYTAFMHNDLLTTLTERGCQHLSSQLLAQEIQQMPVAAYFDPNAPCQNQPPQAPASAPAEPYKLNVTSFRMDLRGNVELLHTYPYPYPFP